MAESARGTKNNASGPCTSERRSHVHAAVPVEAHRRARMAAFKSGLSFRSYLAKLLMMAEPIGQEVAEAPKEPSDQAALGNANGNEQGQPISNRDE